MVNYWMCITNEENWKVIKEQKIWGVPEKRGRRLIEGVRPGDLLVIYVMPKRIGGIFRAISEPFESREKIFNWAEFGREEIFPYRVRLEPVNVPETPRPFEKLLGKLSFTKDVKRWSLKLRRATLKISNKDFKLISQALEG